MIKDDDGRHPCPIGLDFAQCVSWIHEDLIREQMKRVHPISGHASSLRPLDKDRPAGGQGEK